MSLNLTKKSLSNISKKKKNGLIFLLLGVGVFAFILAIYNGIDMERGMKIIAEKNKRIESSQISDEANSSGTTAISWAINMENKFDNLEETNKKVMKQVVEETKQQVIAQNKIILDEITRANQVIKGKLQALEEDKNALEKQLKASQEQNKINLKIIQEKIKSTKEELEGAFEDADSGVLLPPALIGSKTNNDAPDSSIFSAINIGGKKEPKKLVKKNTFTVASYENTFAEVNNTKEEKVLTPEEELMQNTYEVLTGFTDGYLITGAYAPMLGANGQGGAGRANGMQTVPVLIETSGDFIMANDTVGSIDKCLLLGVSTGNAGTRSVEIRLDKMTCLVGDSKKVLQGKVEGYVVSETGQPGLSATLIYKAGDFISRMIASGVLEGLSTAVVNAAATYNTQNAVGTQFYGNTMAGAGDGMSNAFTKLADFYLQLAEATIPILEVKPGRFVSIVLIGGNKFQLKDVNLLDTREVDSYIDEFIGE